MVRYLLLPTAAFVASAIAIALLSFYSPPAQLPVSEINSSSSKILSGMENVGSMTERQAEDPSKKSAFTT